MFEGWASLSWAATCQAGEVSGRTCRDQGRLSAVCWTLWACSSSSNDETDTSIVSCEREQLTVTRADSTWHGVGRPCAVCFRPFHLVCCRSSSLWCPVRSCLYKQGWGSGWHCLLELEEPWRGTLSSQPLTPVLSQASNPARWLSQDSLRKKRGA